MKILVIGTGYVGLVTGACLAYTGNKVICLDVDNKKINDLNNGKIPIFEPGLSKIVRESISNNCLFFSTNYSDSIKDSDIIFIAVGTPMKDSGESDLKYINSVSKSIGLYIDSYKLVVVKSTVPVGTTFKVQKIIKDEILKRNSKINFDIANNPEFLKEGKAVNDFMSPDRIVVGLNNQKNKKTFKELFKPFSINHDKLIFMDILSSELTKYAANAMLATKISFMNEMANISEKLGADINKVRLGIGSDNRIGFSFIYPSVGYGGSCFPKDVNSIINFSNKKGYTPKILEAVNDVNENQKKYFFDKLFERFKSKKNDLKNKKFGIWGLSFKPGTDDMRESASIYFVEKIINLGGSISVYDPRAIDNAKNKYFNHLSGITYCQSKLDVLKGSDALILLTEWPEFRSPDFEKLGSILKNKIIFDGRNQFDKEYLKKIGFEYHQIGVRQI
ncbi:MAG: UDP-glucose 6-dehydrogenase [Candidatus Marinimicrobia bacterium]|nr:UDP-glucose 6-dehydrogenase [Candidatus Neomarinimicrobiota bacterium]|tara:strand:+ start:950 stop:2290 length:1341 start_codon:yes stop_codon:yes gene_type:complete